MKMIILLMMTLLMSSNFAKECTDIDFGDDIVQLDNIELSIVVFAAISLKNNTASFEKLLVDMDSCPTKVNVEFTVREHLGTGEYNILEVRAHCEDDYNTEDAEEFTIYQRYSLEGEGGLLCESYAG